MLLVFASHKLHETQNTNTSVSLQSVCVHLGWFWSVFLRQSVSDPLGFLPGRSPAGADIYWGRWSGDKGSSGWGAWTVRSGSKSFVAKPWIVADQQQQAAGDRVHWHHQVNTITLPEQFTAKQGHISRLRLQCEISYLLSWLTHFYLKISLCSHKEEIVNGLFFLKNGLDECHLI